MQRQPEGGCAENSQSEQPHGSRDNEKDHADHCIDLLGGRSETCAQGFGERDDTQLAKPRRKEGAVHEKASNVPQINTQHAPAGDESGTAVTRKRQRANAAHKATHAHEPPCAAAPAAKIVSSVLDESSTRHANSDYHAEVDDNDKVFDSEILHSGNVKKRRKELSESKKIQAD